MYNKTMKQGWEIKKLGEVAHISPSKSEVKTFALNPMDMVSFLPMEDLTIGRTFVHPNKQKTLSEVEGSYTYFKEGDVLLAKVTPCFENGKLAIAKGLCNNIGFGSSEYIVIRPMQHIVNSQYLIYLLQTNAFRNGGRTLMIGACGLKRLPKPYVANYELPVPSLAEQERIVEILDREFEKIDALKENAEKNLQHAKDLFQSALQQELQPKEGWETKTIGEISELKGGKRVPKGYKLEIEPTGYPYIRVADFNDNGTVDLDDIHYISEKVYEGIKRYTITTNDVYISIAGTIGKSGIIPEDLNGANLTENACRLVFKEEVDKKYIYYCTISSDFKEQIAKLTMQAAQPKLALTRLATATLNLPSVGTQREIVARIDILNERCKALEENYKKTIALCDDMKQALLRKAFNGEL